MKRVVLVLTLLLVTMVGTLVTDTTGPTPAATAQAADLRAFDPGNIISDQVFYDGRSMSASAVQAFLTAKGSNCTAGSLCLKNYTLTTTNRPADSLCAGYTGGPNESAATVITKVAVSCQVSPKVLLVLLQKEMGLVTATAPTAKKYERAAGYACPDNGTGSCDPAYAGLQNQLYRSAWQYRKYRANPNSYGFVAGQYNDVLWNPNSGCGRSTLYIANQATAGLYNYTPYRPNQAALNAGYGTGDSCSAYGNRNFWLYFTDWFGSTQGIEVSGAIGTVWTSSGGATGPLGAPVGQMSCTGNGCAQQFSGGWLAWTSAAGVRQVSGTIGATWGSQGAGSSAWGYPTTDMTCPAGGCLQSFQNGTLTWTAAGGLHGVSGALGWTWAAKGGPSGPWGYPTADMTCPSGGCSQTFQRTVAAWTPTRGVQQIDGSIGLVWASQGAGAGGLGHPTDAMTCPAGGCLQPFQNGTLTWTPAGYVRAVTSTILSTWNATGGPSGVWGWPTADATCSTTGCDQQFERAHVYAGKTQRTAQVVSGLIGQVWTSYGAGASGWGYPTDAMTCATTGCTQPFERGTLTWTPTRGVHAVTGAIQFAWRSQGGSEGAWGHPTEDMVCADGGCTQQFQGTRVVWSATTGVQQLSGAIGASWTAQGAGSSGWGYPVSAMTCSTTGCQQTFQRGILLWTAADGVHAVSGGIQLAWLARSGATGPLGHPVADMTCGLPAGGCSQAFAGGGLYWSPTTGVHAVLGSLDASYRERGGPSGSLGYPTGEESTTAGARRQSFQNGDLTAI